MIGDQNIRETFKILKCAISIIIIMEQARRERT
jgi:hypothetical protein